MAKSRFPTRRYPYRRSGPQLDSDAIEASPTIALEEGARRLVLGLDPEPTGRLLSNEDLSALLDPFALAVLSQASPPLSLNGLLSAVNQATGEDSLPEQQVFVVAEGGQIAWSEQTKALDRGLRVVVVRSRGGDARLLVSTTYPFDGEGDAVFLQVAGWDQANGIFNFYERRHGRWFWAGNSWHALSEPTRGRGPFDSHVNGALVMKELRLPWLHWHSMSQSISLEVFNPGNPISHAPLLRSIVGAESLERGVIVPAVERWTRRRFDGMLSDARELKHVQAAMRQVLTTTTVNIYSSPELLSVKGDEDRFAIPMDFLLDREALFGELDVVPDSGVVYISAGRYREALLRYSITLRDSTQGFAQDGDLPFPFAVPGRAFEDTVVLRELIQRELISRKFAAALLMIDFSNPTSSPMRAALMRFVPDVVDLTHYVNYPIEMIMLSAMREAAPFEEPGSAARLLLADLELDDWRSTFSQRLTAYLRCVQARIDTAAGVDDYFKLLDARRRAFRDRPIAEFDLSLPSSNIPASEPDLIMLPDGSVVARDPYAGV
ncbi:hypothetical protein IYY11_02525 [Methylocystis sp. H62]|uniref:hypothetical protein n=1 Tax=Methylocystis sp. H62 TaxID=2785789 RepID=UPI0018C2CD42|nr:hypothetical protein [Methylocystis sp. H62]MBG0792335.1 hypothetical protein [Methylocystis sp. H62]